MKKELFCLFIVLATILTMFFSGCGKENKPEALAGNHDEYASLDTLKVANDATLFLMRNGIQYHTGEILYLDGNQVGVKESAEDNGHLCFNTLSPDCQKADLISIKDLPVPIIHENDKVYAFAWESEFGINAVPLKFVGYSPLIIVDAAGDISVEEKNHILNKKIQIKAEGLRISLIDENNKRIKDISLEEARKLKYGQRVEIYLDDKTGESQVLRTSATCAYYEYDTTKKYIELDFLGKEIIGKNEYSVYDPTKLEKGYYVLCSGGSPRSVFVVQ